MRCADLPSSVRSRSGQPCSPFEAGALPVLRPARPRFRFGLTRAPHESPTSGGYRRIHIRRRGRVLRNSPPPASVRSANRPEPWPRLAPSGVRRGARGLGLSHAPCAAAPVVFAAIRAAMLRRRDTTSSPCDVSHRASDEPRRRMSLSSALDPSSLASPSIRRVFLRSFCARRRLVSSLSRAAYPPSEAESPKASSMRGANPSRRLGRGASPRRPLPRGKCVVISSAP